MNENHCVQAGGVPLPEDIQKLKWQGQFDQAQRVIGLRLENDLPQGLRQRLLLEREILKRMPEHYPYTWDQALERLQRELKDFREEELTALWEADAADWIYIQGQVRFACNFFENIVKTRPAYGKRLKDSVMAKEKAANFQKLDQAIAEMEKAGGAALRLRLHSTLKLAPEAEREGEPIRVYLPLPVLDAQMSNIQIENVWIGGEKAGKEACQIGDERSPQRTICFDTLHRRGQTYEVEYSFENHAPYVDLSQGEALEKAAAACAETEQSGPEVCQADLQQLQPHIRFTPYLKSLAAQIVGTETNPIKKARRIYDYITSHIMYSFVRPYATITDIAEYTASSLKGDCGFQALLFITLCRIAGVPARWQSGLYTAPGRVGCHDWAQFYAAPFGWLYADCSFGGSAWREGHLNAQPDPASGEWRKRWDFYFGNLEPYRMVAAREFQADFQPPMEHFRNDPYDNQVGEAQYRDRSLLPWEYETRHEIREIFLPRPSK